MSNQKGTNKMSVQRFCQKKKKRKKEMNIKGRKQKLLTKICGHITEKNFNHLAPNLKTLCIYDQVPNIEK